MTEIRYPEVIYRKGRKPKPQPQVQHQMKYTSYLGNKLSKVVVVDPKTGLVKRVPVGPE